MNPWMIVSASAGGLGIVLGAFGAHALQARLGPEQLSAWHTAVHYHLLHAVVLLALALHSARSKRPVALQGWLFSLGLLLFSGSIYGLVLTDQRWLGPLTPLGGLLFLAGWLSLVPLARSQEPHPG